MPLVETKVLSRKAKTLPKKGLRAGTERATSVEPISATSIVSRGLYDQDWSAWEEGLVVETGGAEDARRDLRSTALR